MQNNISTNDRSFLFGDGIFTTIRIENNKPVFLAEHLLRLQQNITDIYMKIDISNLHNEIMSFIDNNILNDGILRVHISRGVGSIGFLPLDSTAKITMQIRPLPKIRKNISLLISKYKKIPLECLPIGKFSSSMNNILARIEAEKNEYDEALQLDIKGNISECSSANIFWQKNDVLYTPSLETNCLNGIIRQKIIENFTTIEVKNKLDSLFSADAAFITNSASLAISIRKINEKIFNKSENLISSINKTLKILIKSKC